MHPAMQLQYQESGVSNVGKSNKNGEKN